MRNSSAALKQQVTAVLLVFTIFLFSHSAAQVPKDSIDLLIVLAQEKLKTDYQSAAADAIKAYRISSRHQYAPGKAKAKFIAGKASYFLNRPHEALQAFTEADSLFRFLGDSIHTGLTLNGIGNVYLQKLDRIVTALEYYNKAAVFLQRDSAALILTLNNIGTVQNRTGNYDAALEIYNVVLDIATKTNNANMVGASWHNIAAVYNRQQNYEQSIHYLEKAIAVAEAQQDSRTISNTLNSMALAYKELKMMPKAMELVKRAIDTAEGSEHFNELVYALTNLSDIHLRNKEFAEAERAALRAERIAREQGVTFYNKYLYEQLSKIYVAAGALDKALRYKEKVAKLNDSIAQVERRAMVNATATVPALAPGPGSNAHNTMNWLAYPAACFLVVGFVWFLMWKKRNSRASLDNNPAASDDKPWNAEETGAVSKAVHHPEGAGTVSHLEVQSGEGLKLLSLDCISWFQKEGNAYYACASGQYYRIRQNINTLEAMLPDTKFFRINRAVIVNMEKISNYSFWENHKYILRMEGEPRTQFTITRARLRELKEKFHLAEKV